MIWAITIAWYVKTENPAPCKPFCKSIIISERCSYVEPISDIFFIISKLNFPGNFDAELI